MSILFVGLHSHNAIDLLWSNKIAATLALDDAPAFEPLKPSYDRAPGHPHVAGDLGDGEGLSLQVPDSNAQADEFGLYPSEASPQTDETCGNRGSDRRFMNELW